MKKFIGFIMIAAVLLLCSCGEKSLVTEDSVQKAPSSGVKRSIYIYMSGGDAEKDYGSATEALREMTRAELSENINVVVETGGSTVWHDEGISPDRLDRFEIQNGSIRKVDSAENGNMGTSATLMDFLKWGNENYPAEDRILIIWGQGGGCVGGTAYDARFNYDSLTPGEIAYALSKSGTDYSMVGFDSCLMSSLETAAAIAPYASFMTASEEIQPCSWDYRKIFNYISSNPTASADRIGQKICDTYYNKCVDIGQEDSVAMAVTDLSEITALTQAFDGLSGRLNTVPDSLEQYESFAAAVKDVHMLGGKSEDEGYSNMFDLRDFAQKVSDSAGYSYSAMEDAVNSAVSYRLNGRLTSYAGGIGIFYPIRQNSDELVKYFDITPSRNYSDFLRSICARTEINDGLHTYKTSWAWSDYMNEKGYFNYGAKINNGCYELNIVGNMNILKDVRLNIYKLDNASGKYLYLSDSGAYDENRDAGIYKSKNPHTCLTLNGRAVTAYTVDKGDGYELYSIPVYIGNVQGNIRAARITSGRKPRYKVYGFWKGTNAAYGISDRKISKIARNAVIEPLSREYGTGDYYKGSKIRVPFIFLREKALPDDEYKFEYAMEDIYGNISAADPSEATVSGKTAAMK